MKWFWEKKHKDKDVVIHDDCYNKLHPDLKKQFKKRFQGNTAKTTHTVVVDNTTNTYALHTWPELETDDSLLLGTFVAAEVAAEAQHETNFAPPQQDDAAQGTDFGGGSGGGAGATGSWDTGSSDSGSSSDSSSSSDSGSSSSVSSSSSDSGSSSSDSGGGGFSC